MKKMISVIFAILSFAMLFAFPASAHRNSGTSHHNSSSRCGSRSHNNSNGQSKSNNTNDYWRCDENGHNHKSKQSSRAHNYSHHDGYKCDDAEHIGYCIR